MYWKVQQDLICYLISCVRTAKMKKISSVATFTASALTTSLLVRESRQHKGTGSGQTGPTVWGKQLYCQHLQNKGRDCRLGRTSTAPEWQSSLLISLVTSHNAGGAGNGAVAIQWQELAQTAWTRPTAVQCRTQFSSHVTVIQRADGGSVAGLRAQNGIAGPELHNAPHMKGPVWSI